MMTMRRNHALGLFVAAIAALSVLYACSGDDNSTAPPGQTTPLLDSGTISPNDTGVITPTNDATPPPVDAGPDATPTCFSGTPTTYTEIINACTDAEAIDKKVDLSSMNLPNGELQPLP